MRIVIVCGRLSDLTNAIRDASRCLADALRDLGHDAVIAEEAVPIGTSDLVVLQYNPFLYGKRGVAPMLVTRLWLERLKKDRARLAVVVHEPYVPFSSLRWVLLGSLQRVQLTAVLTAADSIYVAADTWAQLIRWLAPRRTMVSLPVGSTLPDMRASRIARREALGLRDGDFAVATLGNESGGRAPEIVERTLRALVDDGRRTVLLALGADGAAPDAVPPEVEVRRPGFLPASELASFVAAADVFLAPFIDGVSARRTSVTAALQHGVPVVGTLGSLTDSWLRETDAIRLVDVCQPNEFASVVVNLSRDTAARSTLGRAGRSLYEAQFEWERIAVRLIDGVGPR